MRRFSISLLACMAFLLILPCVGVHASDPPADPFLRIDADMHTAMINRIAVDASNRFLVTGSDDKTVRVWDPATGRRLRTLRPPMGPGDEGKMYAVAITPDGSTVACGGWAKEDSIYLFDRASGRMTRRIAGLPNVVLHLTFSKDGRYLAAALGGKNGIRVYRAPSYAPVAEDTDYGNRSNGADFDSQGRLVTSCYDGYIRLYDAGFKRTAKKKGPGGDEPYDVRFSPDGSKIAVAYRDSTKVDVLSGRDLSLLYSPDTSGADNGDLSSVCWSADGRFLYAGGVYDVKGTSPIRKWSGQGRGPYTDLPAAPNTIMHILPLNRGGMVFGSAEPAFGAFDAGDRRVVFQGPPIADYRNNREGFRLSPNGASVGFGYERWGKSSARFAVDDRRLELDPTVDPGLAAPVTSADGLSITGWKNTYTPKLNNEALKLKDYEMSRSLAVAPDGETFLLGASWYLRLFDRQGSEKWRVPVPGTAWSVNVTGNGKLACAAYGDGTIRWHRMQDGRELLAFFPHEDRKRWVLWTPSGYYDASPGAEDLIGWHKNNGRDQAADFYPASRFRSVFYRPDVVARVLDSLDEAEAVRLDDAEAGRRRTEASIERILPPIVELLHPEDGAELFKTEVTVVFTLRSPSDEPITGVKALVDGRPVGAERGIRVKPQGTETRKLRITVPERDCRISIIAENRHGAGDPATVRVKWRGKHKAFVVKPKLYVLSIGVSDYQDQSLQLRFAAKDARDFAGAMEQQQGRLYREVTTKVLTDARAHRDDIMDGLDWIRAQATSKDVAMVFLAGHGVNDQSGYYYFLPVNADTKRLMRTGVAFSDIKRTVESLAGKTLCFVDTCHSGNVMGARRGVGDINAVVNELTSAESGAVVFAASTGKQYSIEDVAWGNGAFTEALVEGVSGKADFRGTGRITVNMLDLYLSERVKELTEGRQTPTTTKPNTVPDFPVTLVDK